MPEPAQFRVIQSGFLSTVQDLGRYGFQRFGMPVGGAMDILALRLGNRLVGNPDSAAVLEITLQGPELTFETDSIIALTGADLSPTLNGNPVQNWTVLCVTRGSTLSFGERRNGARAYLAVAGGINVPLVLGSRSTHIRSRTGGIRGRALLKGDVLHGHPPSSDAWKSAGRALPSAAHPSYPPDATLRVVSGPQSDCFVPDALGTLVHGPYTISPQSDRMGYRLIGPPLPHAQAPNLISDATPPGAVQVPASHQPILLMADRPTTGGYPKIAVVISADLPLAAQLVPGDCIRFSLIEVSEAQVIVRDQRARLDAVLPPVGRANTP